MSFKQIIDPNTAKIYTDLIPPAAAGVASVSAGTAITVTGTPTNPIINNNGVASVSAGNGIQISGTTTPTITNSACLFVNTSYVNDNIIDIQTAVNSAAVGEAVMVSSGSYGGATLSIVGKTQLTIICPFNQTPVVELGGGRGLSTDATSSQIRINGLQVEGATALSSTGNNYYSYCNFQNGVAISGSGNHFFNNCELTGGTLNLSAGFTGLVFITECSFAGTAFTLSQPSAAQCIISLCTGLGTFPANATFIGTNLSAVGVTRTDTVQLYASGSQGSAEQVLTSTGSAVGWATPLTIKCSFLSLATVPLAINNAAYTLLNNAAVYTWTNTFTSTQHLYRLTLSYSMLGVNDNIAMYVQIYNNVTGSLTGGSVYTSTQPYQSNWNNYLGNIVNSGTYIDYFNLTDFNVPTSFVVRCYVITDTGAHTITDFPNFLTLEPAHFGFGTF